MLRTHFLKGLVFVGTFLCTLASLQAAPSSGGHPPVTQQAQRLVPIQVQQITQAINPAQYVPMATGVRPEANAANDRGLVADSLELDDMLLLLHRPENSEQALEQFMTEQVDPNSANYHQWLTAEQVGEYGPAASDIDTLTSWLQSEGFSINQVAADGMVIDFSGTAGDVRNAFHTEIHNLSVNGAAHIANFSQPQIPAALAPAVVGIVSINDFRPNTEFKQRQSPAYTFPTGSSSEYALVPADLATIYNLNPLFSAGINGSGQTIVLIEDSNVFSTSDVSTFRSTFGLQTNTFSTVHPSCTNPGDPNNGTDFEVELDIEYAGAAAPGASLELASCADTFASFGGLIAMQNLNSANDAARLWSVSYGFCEAANGASANAAFSSTYQTAAARGVSVFVAAGDEGAASCDANMEKATHGIGVSGFASTPYNVAVGGTDFGDSFAGTNSTYWNSSNTATFGSALSYINEIPWNDSCASQLIASTLSGQPGGGNGTTYGANGLCNSTVGTTDFLTTASGSGGPSGCASGTPSTDGVVSGTCAGTAKPSWQTLVGNPQDGVRDIPDVSLFSANGVWGHYWVVCYSRTSQGGTACTGAPSGWAGGGGTSFASPIMAGIQALINQKTASSQGNPNPTYYALAAIEYGTSGNAACNSTLGNAVDSSCVFYDVTQGDMDVNCTGSFNCFDATGSSPNGVLSTTSNAYSPAYGTTTASFTGGAAAGWDFATGIGSLNACNLVDKWPGVTSPITCNSNGSAASKLAFTMEPNTSYAAGTTITVKVSVENSSGSVITSDHSAVTLTLAGGTAGATLNGTATVNAVSGVATFTLSVDTIGAGYLLSATDASLTGATSKAFNITLGPATKLAFIQNPSNTVAGAVISPAVTVQVQDAGGNPITSSSAAVTLAIGTNPGTGTLSGTTTRNASGGLATFNNLSINHVGTGYTLSASGTALTSGTSSSFNITVGNAMKLAFVQQPTDTVAGTSIAPAVTVAVQDANGNTVTTNSSAVTLSIGTNPAGGTLSGTKTANAVNGVATFSNLSIDKTATGYTLAAADGSLTMTTSSLFTINPGTATQVAFVQQPTTAPINTPMTPAVTVAIEDANGNVVTTNTSLVTLIIGTNPSAGTLSGTTTTVAVSGVATFSNLSINNAGIGYTLTASDGTLTGATSNTFNITLATPVRLAFGQQPTNTIARSAISPAVTVQVLDALGNPVVGNTSSVTIAIGANPGGATLGGTLTVNASNGVATFTDLTLDQVGTGYTLTAASTGLIGATSSAFNIGIGPATQIVFTTQPVNVSIGDELGTIAVTEEDTNGNTVPDTAAVDFSINACGGTVDLGSVAMNNGTATLDSAQRFYTLATANKINANSGTFNAISAGYDVGTNTDYIFADGLEMCRL